MAKDKILQLAWGTGASTQEARNGLKIGQVAFECVGMRGVVMPLEN